MLNSKAGMVGAGVLVLGGLAYMAARKAKGEALAAAKAVGGAIDPTSDKNFIYQGIGEVVDALDDGVKNNSGTLGTKIYDLFHLVRAF